TPLELRDALLRCREVIGEGADLVVQRLLRGLLALDAEHLRDLLQLLAARLLRRVLLLRGAVLLRLRADAADVVLPRLGQVRHLPVVAEARQGLLGLRRSGLLTVGRGIGALPRFRAVLGRVLGGGALS